MRKLTVVSALAVMTALAHTHPAHADSLNDLNDAILEQHFQDDLAAMRHDELMDRLETMEDEMRWRLQELQHQQELYHDQEQLRE
jgi:TolA-binding protein